MRSIVAAARATPRRALAVVAAAGLASLAAGVVAGGRAQAGGAAASQVTLPASGITFTRPKDWHLVEPPITALSRPVERLLLTTYRTRPGGNCSPDRAVRDLPARGALVYLFEYRPSAGDPWRGLRRSDFPRRPARFELQRSALGNYECWRAPSYLIRFRDADRPFQLHVALGRKATAARRAQVLRVLASLRFAPLPPPPPDPFAGWSTLTEEVGDSLRIPPGWIAAATTSPRRYARPRTLFFASNVRVRGLPPRRGRTPRRLPRAIPAAALPPAGVLLTVREEPKGPATADFPPNPKASWPRAEDYRTVERPDALTRERAGTTSGRHRFSIWIVSGPAATESDRELARKAAATFGYATGRFRDRSCRRACLTG